MKDSNVIADKKIHASPTKDFFVKMITRDIALEDCIFDLLDNAIDGAHRKVGVEGGEKPLAGYWAKISFSSESFEIRDNCGGIRLSDAIDYAFHFGRRPDSPSDVSGGIGLYGIGMKRAIFKIGRMATVVSDPSDTPFKVVVNVADWERKSEADWDFDYEDCESNGTGGTSISVSDLNPGIGSSFEDPVFRNELLKMIGRDYAFFIDKGFEISICDLVAPSYKYRLKIGEEIEPAVESYDDDGVHVRLVAGLADDLPDDIPDELMPKDVDRYGWYVVCNDRLVLAADKTDKTIWGDDNYRVWHPQYNGFAGFLFFVASDQGRLPWTTTKREVDGSSPLYRRAVRKMKAITDVFTAYTQKRKLDLETAKAAERASHQVDVYRAATPQTLRLPSVKTSAPKVEYAHISYRRPLPQISEIRNHLDDRTLNYKEIGEYTFDYFMKVELGK